MGILSQVATALAIGTVAVAQNVVPRPAMTKGMAGMAQKAEFWEAQKQAGLLPLPGLTTVTGNPQACTNGKVTVDMGRGDEDFPCDEVDFNSFISLDDLNIPNPCFADDSCIGPAYEGTTQGSDIWGWLSPEGREITIDCVDNGVWFVDSTDPNNPIRLGWIKSDRPQYAWCDVKVYQDTAYIVKDGSDEYETLNNGIQIFDLKQLVCAEAYDNGGVPVEYFPHFVYREHGAAHNILVDNDSGFLFSVGVERYSRCFGGIHMMNIKDNPLRPEFVGCLTADGYTHDAQCVTYDGPDTDYTGKEICFAYNEDTITIWDITDKANATIISKSTFAGFEYIHQGWLTDDMRYILVDDELDEVDGGLNRTHTYVFDVSDLDAPIQKPTFIHADDSIDHNLYVWGSIHKRGWGGNAAMGSNAPDTKYAYLSNYAAGLRILDLTNIETGMSEAGFFDVAPDLNSSVFEGTWSNYMHPSGTVAVSSIDRGLFFLTPRMAYDGPAPVPQVTNASSCPDPPPTLAPTAPTTSAPTGDCYDYEGLQYSDGSPAPCVTIFGFCEVSPLVRENCQLTCDSCDEFTPAPTFSDLTNPPTPSPIGGGSGGCQDTDQPGINFEDGAPANCYEIKDFCTNNRVVRDRCPVSCGTCNKVNDVVTLPKDPDTEPDAATETETIMAAAGIVGATFVVALSVFSCFVQTKSYKLVSSLAR